MTATAVWLRVRERGSPAALRLMVAIALGVGWPLAQALLYPVTLFFLLTAPARQRRAMRRYLTRALGRAARFRDLWRLWHCFASCLLDRVYLLTGRSQHYRFDSEGFEALIEVVRQGRGVVLLSAHLGSFDALRAVAAAGAPIEVRMLMYPSGGAVEALLAELAPERAQAVIPLGRPEAMIAAREVIARGGIVGLLADRAGRSERMLRLPFLGVPAPLPAGPIMLAGLLGAPLFLGFALRCGARHYRLIFEPFTPPLALPRQGREAVIADHLRRYAARLEALCRAYPYNWFNFYDFWGEEET